MRGRLVLFFTFAIVLFAGVSQVSAGTIVNLNATSASTASQTLVLGPGSYTVTIIGTSTAGALYNGWNSAANPSTNNLWTDRYGFQYGSGDQLGSQSRATPDTPRRRRLWRLIRRRRRSRHTTTPPTAHLTFIPTLTPSR